MNAPSAIAIRDGTDADIVDIADIYAHHVRHGLASFEIEAPDADEMARRRREIVGRGFPYLVAERAGAILGYAYAGPYRTRPAYRFAAENSVYVRPGLERQGIGRLLLGALIRHCEAIGLRQMIAIIGDSANIASIRLHERMGFETIGTIRSVGWKLERWVDSVLLQRALGAGDRAPP